MHKTIQLNCIIFSKTSMLLFLLISIYPTFMIEAIQHDSLRLFDAENHSSLLSSCMADDIFNFLLYINRPIFGLVECFTFNFVDTFNDILIIKTVIALLFFFTAFLFVRIFTNNGIEKNRAYLFTSLIMLLPFFQYLIQYNFIPLLLSINFIQICFINIDKNYNFWKHKSYSIKFNSIFLSSIFLQIALLTYPIHAFIFLGLISLKLRLSSNKKIIFLLSFFFINLLIGLILQKSINFHFGGDWSWVPEHYKLTLNPSVLIQNFHSLIFNRSIHILNLWFLNSNYIWLITLTFIVIITSFRFISVINDKSEIKFLLKLFCLLLISFTPLILTSFEQQRVLVTTQIVLIIFMMIIFPKIRFFNKSIFIKTILLILVLSLSLISANRLKNNNKSIQLEMNFIKEEINNYKGQIRRVHFIKSESKTNFYGYDNYQDEFYIKNTSFNQNLKKLVNIIINEDDKKIQIFDATNNKKIIPTSDILFITVSEAEEQFCMTEDMLIIDMKKLEKKLNNNQNYYESYDIQQCNHFKIESNDSVSDKTHFYSRVYDNSNHPNDFWETQLEKDIDLIFSFDEPIYLKSYSFIPPSNYDGFNITDYTERYPIDWKIEGSNDRVNWDNIQDTRNGLTPSDPLMIQRYDIENQLDYSHIKFTFYKNKERLLRIYEIKLDY